MKLHNPHFIIPRNAWANAKLPADHSWSLNSNINIYTTIPELLKFFVYLNLQNRASASKMYVAYSEIKYVSL